MRTLRYGSLFALLACFATAGCNSTNSIPGSQSPNAQPTRCPAANYTCIQHVVVIIQENRSFNNLFMGYPGAETQNYGMAGSRKVPLRKRTFEQSVGDISHCWWDAKRAYDGGKMDGFFRERGESWPIANCPSLAFDKQPVGTTGIHSPYVYLPNDAPNYKDEAGPYWAMAMQYVLADHYFPTDFGPSFTAHQYLVAGTTMYKEGLAIADYPGWLNDQGGVNLSSATSWSCNSPSRLRTSLLDVHRRILPNAGPFPCFTEYRTIAKSLRERHVSWQFYTPTTTLHNGKSFPNGDYIWNPFSAIKAVRYGPDWPNVITPETNVLDTAKAGGLKAVTWVVPSGQESDHSGPYRTDEGPSWVAAVVNAIGTGPEWRSTAIVLLWDDWGVLYDPVSPPQLDFRGLGIRTPLIIISPYAQQGKVSKTQYEPGSILKFIETVFNLPPIAGRCPGPPSQGYTDCRANILGGFDFTQTPRPFTKFKAKYGPSTFTNMQGPELPPDNE